jgi:hypothetical protein
LCAVRTTQDQPWIRFNRAYLKEIVPVLPPGPDILLSGDVERNPRPHPYPRQLGVIEYTIDDLEGMAQWQREKVQDCLEEASRFQVY